MVNEKRNANVVAMLVASLTVGAGLLLVLEPHSKTGPASTTLAALRGERVNSLVIEWAEEGSSIMRENALRIDSDATVSGSTDGEGRLVVFSARGGMSAEQQESVLAVLKTLSESRGLSDRRVTVAYESDPTHHAQLPKGAHDLYELLVKKAFVSDRG